ncbi:MAG: glycosyltransferase family 4 protein [Bacteroidota bacterium]
MKILLVHNFYGSTAPSGENTAYLAEASLLRNRGHSVIEFNRHSDELLRENFFGRLKGAASAVWNPFSLRALKVTIEETKPDIVHVHNTFPLLSPSVLYASRRQNIPTVMTLHNYRIGCSAGTAVRKDQPCTLCLDKKSVMPALRFGCYRDSRIATVPVSAMIAFHNARKTWRRNVDAFITLSDFQRDTMIKFGIPAESLFVKPHFLEHPPQPVPWNERDQKAIFVGRLYAAKGIHILLEAWKRMGKGAPPLEVVGDGPMRAQLVRSIEESGMQESVSFVGNVSHQETMDRISKAKLLIVPSLCFEGFPMVVLEAFALGVPVAASNIGSLPSLISENRSGKLFTPGDAGEILSCVKGLLGDDAKLRLLGEAVRNEFADKYTAEKNYGMLTGIYEAAASRRRMRYYQKQ